MQLINSESANLDRSGPHQRHGELYGALWCFGFALVWLLPTRTLPWTTFYAEALCAFMLLILAFWALRQREHSAVGLSRGVLWQPPVGVLLTLAGVAALQALTGRLVLPTEVYWFVLAIAGMALAWLVASHAERCAPGRLIDHLWIGVLLASWASVGIALFQWSGVLGDWGLFVPGGGPGGRAEAHVGQANNLASLLCWGLVAVWWNYERGRFSAATALILAVYLVIGIALTRSRTAWISLCAIAIVALLIRDKLDRPVSRWVPMLLGALLTLLWIGLPLLSSQSLLGVAAAIDERVQMSVGPREQIYRMALAAVWERPWFGWGWGQVAQAQVALAPQFPTYGGFASYAHNLLFDLLIWFGIPVGLTAMVVVCVWLLRSLRQEQRPQAWMLFAAISVFGVHAMLELPHGYAYFYLTTALLGGTLSGMSARASGQYLPRWLLWAWWCGLVVALGIVVRDYRLVESEHLSWRLYEARIGRGIPPSAPDLWVLDAIPMANLELRRRPTANMTFATREHWRRVVARHPALGAMARYAQGAALNGDAEGVHWALSTICLLFEAKVCRQVLTEFRDFEQMNQLPSADLSSLPPLKDGPAELDWPRRSSVEGESVQK